MNAAAQTVAKKLHALRKELERFVVGHERVKNGLLLGLLAREHIYIEGPPGMAKTMLAEIVSRASGLDFYFYQFHRDTRLAELVGDMVIERAPTEHGGEVIAQTIRRGGVLTAEICVLDDISRAPGEALNVLLRILNERAFQDERIPLLTVIATSNPTADEYYNEPLDPANLDRFTIQLRSSGLIHEKDWQSVRKVIDLYAEQDTNAPLETHKVISRTDLDEAYGLLQEVVLSESIKQMLIRFFTLLVEHRTIEPSNALLTDRSFLVKAIKIIKAEALLQGRLEVEPADLQVLGYLTTFRLPEEVNRDLPGMITKVTHASR